MTNSLNNSFLKFKNIAGLIILALIFVSSYSYADNKENGMSVLNTYHSEDRPLFSSDGSILFFNSTKPVKQNQEYYSDDNYEYVLRYDYNVYYSIYNDNRWSEPKLLDVGINSENDDCIVALSLDGKKIYFCSFRPDWDLDGGPFYEGDIIKGSIVNIKPMSGGIAKFFKNEKRIEYFDEGKWYEKFSIFGGTITPDGNKFYFATDVGRKYGEMDIWVSEKMNGKWSYPINLGPSINKAGSINYEPYIAPDGKTLFYSTNYNSKYRDMNIYYSNNDGKNWSEPIKLGKEINSNDDDLQVYCPVLGDKFVIVRNIIQKQSANKEMKEYSLIEKAKVLPNYSIIVCSVTDSESGENLDAQVNITSINYGTSYQINISNENKTIETPLHRNLSYEVVINKEGYEPYRYTLNLNEQFEDKEILLNISLKKIKDNDEVYPNTLVTEEINNKQIRIYPNPAIESLNIDFTHSEEMPTWIEILSVTGERIVRFDVSGNKKGSYNIDISGYSVGTYIVNVGFNSGYISYKFIKN